MSEGNGIIKFGGRGRRKFQIGEVVFEVDVIAAHNRWIGIDRTFRNEDGSMPPAKLDEANEAALLFTRLLIISAVKNVPFEEAGKVNLLESSELVACMKSLTIADALEFLKLLTDQGTELLPFFLPKSPGERSSPGSTGPLSFSVG